MSVAPPFLSSSSPHTPLPPGIDAPATCEVPHFAPVRVRGGRHRLRRLVRHRRRALAAGLAVTAAALVAAGPREADGARGHPAAEPVRQHRAVERVSAPVRIADGATVRLLRPGDHVDVIAAQETATGGDARVVARGARVTKVPEPLDASDAAVESGALVVLSVPRATAARLAGASATARLAVTLC
ncbi:RcpC/CpaB family pilus assembly protein [Streptomyces sp. PAN_FS17]|uniref:RcpC/CpaB family pilus assembly protein n=1 Tax=Streptomyces sp. PAN_FS17 TaxID=1855351 RepID=UPI00089BE354|nr:RcpC/CpaB family pilus assembly protein [Streptomyces sp. PAN_FS17]SEC66116.1 Flp pilus assembly protein RcpC/CpaB [Streptomyces sp. PAN_FS17]